MSEEKSNVIQQKFKLGERPYTDLRQFLLPYVEISPAYKTKKFRMQYEPEIKPCHMDGVWAPLRGISYHCKSVINFKPSLIYRMLNVSKNLNFLVSKSYLDNTTS